MTTIRFSIPSASADANTNANKYIEKSKLMEKLSNLDRWLRENGSEMNESADLGSALRAMTKITKAIFGS